MPLCSREIFAEVLPQKGVLMGMDLGTKTLGLALSDADWCVASPFKTVVRKKWREDAHVLRALWERHDVCGLVVGWPLLMNGEEGARCHATRHMVENMLTVKDFPCLLWDERLSTSAAEWVLEKEADLSRQKRSRVVDAVAASWVLTGALEALRQLG